MPNRPARATRRAVTAAAILALLTATSAAADTLRGDSDVLTAGAQSSRDLGDVAPGAVIDVPVAFELQCRNGSHLDRGQSVVIGLGSQQVPSGATVRFDPVSLGPVPAGWPADGDFCAGQTVATQATVRLTAPTATGPQAYSLMFTRSLTPAGNGDDSAVTGFTAVDLTLTVVDNTPPTLQLPADLTVEGDTIGGAIAAYAVTATDAEDDPAPTPACDPAAGSTLPVGRTTITCTVTDTGNLTDEAAFAITVVDTTAPPLLGIPAALNLTTPDPAGARLAYDLPTADDVVDDAPRVTCTPAAGDVAPVGDSTVTCTATDGSGNGRSATFPVHVTLLGARWESPVGGEPAALVANQGRTVPVKVRLFRDGVEVTTGRALLAVLPDGGAGTTSALTVPLEWRPDTPRWTAQLDTSALAAGTYRAVSLLDGHEAGAFRLDIRGGSAVPARADRASAR